MMNGWVDNAGRALISISVKPTAQSAPTQLEAWIDTGFTGELVLPQNTIAALGLPQSGTVGAQLANGAIMTTSAFTCIIDWLGQEKQIEVIENTGRFPLRGVGMLRDHALTVDYPRQSVTLTSSCSARWAMLER